MGGGGGVESEIGMHRVAAAQTVYFDENPELGLRDARHSIYRYIGPRVCVCVPGEGYGVVCYRYLLATPTSLPSSNYHSHFIFLGNLGGVWGRIGGARDEIWGWGMEV